MTARTMKPDTARALVFLRARGRDGATNAEAWRALGQERFAARVWELIHEHGHRIEKVMERSEDGKRYARWYLAEAPTFVPTTGAQETWL